MSILDLVSTLNELDISVQIVENRLEFEAPDGIMTLELIDEIKENKEELIKFLSQRHEIKAYPTLRPASKKEYYILSSPQKRMYLLQQLDLESTAYNIPTIINLDIAIDKNILYDIFRTLIDRHESLRSSFEIINGEPIQRIHSPRDIEFRIANYDLKDQKHEIPDLGQTNAKMQNFTSHNERLLRGFVRPFDLSKPPLLRVGLSEAQGDIRLLIDMHHIISDGISFRVLEEEINAIIDRQVLPALQFQYKDYAEWLIHPDYRKMVEFQEEYWLCKFSDDFPLIDLPWDYPRPTVRSFMGKKVRFRLSEEETAIIKDITKATGATLFMVILSIYSIMLSKLSGDEDIIVGTPIAGRRHHYLERTIGVFINTLTIRSFPQGEKSYKEFLEELKGSTLEAFENQEYQFEELVEKTAVSRDTGRNPITDILFNHLNQVEHLKDSLKLFELEGYFHEEGISKFDLTLTTLEYEDRIYCSFEYCTQLFEPRTVERFIGYLKKIILEISSDFERKISDIRIIPAEEMERFLFEFNDTKADYAIDKSIHQLIEEQAERIPDSMALFFRDESISYKELNESGNRLAGVLKRKGIRQGAVGGIMLERSLEMMVGILAILKSGGAYLPIDTDYPQERVRYMLSDSGSGLLLTGGDFLGIYSDICETIDLRFSDIYEINPKSLLSLNISSDLAYVTYTSGSTGKPKGVMIRHSSVVNFIKGMTDVIEFKERDIILSLTTICFDIFGLETILPLTKGTRVVIGGREEQLNPAAAGFAMLREDVSILQVTPSRLSLLMEDREAIGALKVLNCLLVGGEAFPGVLLEKVRKVTGCMIYNLYGPTETTIWSTLKELGKSGSLNIGKPISNTGIYIVDKYDKLQPMGIPGELCISGDGLAVGYLNRAELTGEKFTILSLYVGDRRGGKNKSLYGRPGSFLANNPLAAEGTRIYKTGDLARWLPDGNIEFVGRIDHQVKLRGFRIELDEIERTLTRHSKIREALVIQKRDRSGTGYLCAFIVYIDDERKTPGNADLREYLSRYLPDYMVPSYFLQIDKIPLTANGKIDRKALPEPEIIAGDEYIAPRDDVEKRLAKIWADVLNIKTELIGINYNFFELGGHSLKAAILNTKIHKEFNVRIPLIDVFRMPTIMGLADLLKQAEKRQFIPIKPTEKKEYYELSAAQKRFYLLQQMGGNSTALNLQQEIVPGKTIDVKKMEETFRQMIRRHESLRTSFGLKDGVLVQKIHEEVDFAVECYKLGDKHDASAFIGITEKSFPDDEREMGKFVRPFDFSKPPLLRVRLIEAIDDYQRLLIDMHHIISDRVSLSILEQEFMSLYSGEDLTSLKLQYKDYVRWQNSVETKESIKQQEDYWIHFFSGKIPVLKLPIDFSNPMQENYECGEYYFSINRELTGRLKETIIEMGVTLFMMLISAYTILLSRLSGQEDVMIGIPVEGRNHDDLISIVGNFVNMVSIRSFPRNELIFPDFLEKLKESALEAFSNQDYRFEMLFDKLKLNRDLNREPLFNTVFNMPDIPRYYKRSKLIGKTKYKPFLSPSDRRISRYEINLYALDINDEIKFICTYRLCLFKRSTIEYIMDEYVRLIEYLLEDHNKSLKDYPIFI